MLWKIKSIKGVKDVLEEYKYELEQMEKDIKEMRVSL